MIGDRSQGAGRARIEGRVAEPRFEPRADDRDLLGSARGQEAIDDLAGGGAPERVEGDLSAGELARGHPEDRVHSAGTELHADLHHGAFEPQRRRTGARPHHTRRRPLAELEEEMNRAVRQEPLAHRGRERVASPSDRVDVGAQSSAREHAPALAHRRGGGRHEALLGAEKDEHAIAV
jgi:hypothetical protein